MTLSVAPEAVKALPLEVQVAQRLIMGYSGTTPSEPLQRLLKTGLGGIIFFRENFEALQPAEPAAVSRLLADLSSQVPENLPRPFLSLDQEGGLIERLPHFLFPSLVSPKAVALTLRDTDSNEFCAEVYDLCAYYLSMLGFTMNFFPTLDVNLEPQNPVIGVRSFGASAETVWRFAKVAMERLEARSMIAVGKHFPGHGNGTVDSHIELPILQFTDEELSAFKQAIEAGIPALMVSHGHYPALQEDEPGVPASASPAIIQGLLRNELGFGGLIISDDMAMGAITRHADPAEAAIRALNAGVDMLIYRDCSNTEHQVYEAILTALKEGQLDLDAHEASVRRILNCKTQLNPAPPNPDTLGKIMSTEAIQAVSGFIATKALSVLQDRESIPIPLDAEDLIWLIHPDRQAIPQYAPDATSSPDLVQLFEEAGLYPVHQQTYVPDKTLPFPEAEEPPEIILFVAYNAHLHSDQKAFWQTLGERFPESRRVLISAGMPDSEELSSQADLHLAMGSYRPASLKALVEFLVPMDTPF